MKKIDETIAQIEQENKPITLKKSNRFAIGGTLGVACGILAVAIPTFMLGMVMFGLVYLAWLYIRRA